MAKVIFLFALAALISCAAAFPASSEGVRMKRSPCQVIVGGDNSGRICSSLTDTAAAASETPVQPASAVAAAPAATEQEPRAKRSPCQVIVGGDNSGRICSSLTDPATPAAESNSPADEPAALEAPVGETVSSGEGGRGKRSPCQRFVPGDNTGTLCGPGEAAALPTAGSAGQVVTAYDNGRCRVLIYGPYRLAQGCTEAEARALGATLSAAAQPGQDAREVTVHGHNTGRICGPGDLSCTVNVGGWDSGVTNGKQGGFGQSA